MRSRHNGVKGHPSAGGSFSTAACFPICAVLVGVGMVAVLIFALSQYRRYSASADGPAALRAVPDFSRRMGDPAPLAAAAPPPAVPQTYDLSPVTTALQGLGSRLGDLSARSSDSSKEVLQALNDVQRSLAAMSGIITQFSDMPDRVMAACQGRDAAPQNCAPAAAAPACPNAPPRPRDAIVGLAKGIPLFDIYRFVRSARAAMGDSIDLVLFTDDASGSLGWLYNAYNVTVKLFNVERDLPPAQAKFHPSSYRWIFMRDWMRSQAAPLYDYLLFIDVRDSVFQADAFKAARAVGRGFFAFLESKPGTIMGCGWNSGWRLQHGHVDDALIYVDMLAGEIERNPCERNGVDQGMHNVFVHQRLEGRVSALHMITNEEGWIATVQSMPTLHRDAVGRVLNALGDPVAVVHQYDRSPALKAQYSREYVWIEEGERGIK